VTATGLKILVLGASGQVGHALLALGPQAEGVGTLPHGAEVIGITRQEADLASTLFAQQLRAAIITHQPTHVINAAAYTAVDRAELEPDLAQAVNADAVETLGHICTSAGAPVIHLSTDYVFDGCKPVGQSYTPDDPTNPRGVYGRTKAEGDARLMATTQAHPALVFRTSWVFSAHGSNFVKTMLALAEQRDELRVVNDQHGAPTSAEWIAQSLLQVCACWPAKQGAKAIEGGTVKGGTSGGGTTLHGAAVRGIFHLTAAGQTTWHAFAQHLLSEARSLAPARPWRVESDEQVIAVSTSSYEQGMRESGRTAPMAPRPMNSVLDNTSTMAHFPLTRPDWATQLQPVLRTLLTPTT
jgi:dTDP-4-dehydrorhamnose reductase